MSESADMTQEEACQALADFLAIAEKLAEFSFYNNAGRKIRYEIEYATEDGQLGKVTVTDNESGEVFEKETSRIQI